MASPSPSPSATSSSWSLVSDTAMARCHHRCASEECPNRDDRQGSNVSMRSSKELSVCQTQHLWECMLDLQESYACYNSTRIDMALDARDQAMEFMPNRFIIDTLNDSLRELPSEGWQKLYRCLGGEQEAPKLKSKRKFWKRA